MEAHIVRDVIALPPAFPFSTSEIQDTISSDFQRIHWHDCLEVNFIKAGTGRILVNSHSMDLVAGDIVLIGSNDLHRHFGSKGLVMQTVIFEPQLLYMQDKYDPDILGPFRTFGTTFHNRLERSHPVMDELRGMLVTIQEEYDLRAASYTTVIRAELLRFLAYVNRHFAKPISEGASTLSRYQPMFRSMLPMMETRLAHSWTLKELAEYSHLSPSRFSALFHEVMGMAPLEYLIHLRIAKAVSLLRETDKKIVDIALECGFRNLSNFHRLFQKHVGKSPRQVR